MNTGIAVVVITKNEEMNIAACLDSVKWADELIVVDSFSTDATVKIALTFTDKVIQREWPGMVGPQRNFGLEQTSSPWVLFLDADERVTSSLKDELLTFIRSSFAMANGAGEIPRRNYFFGKWLKCSYPNYTRRLLRKGCGRYNEQPGLGFDTLLVDDGLVYRFRNPLEHFTSETIAQRFGKIDFDSSLQADEKYRALKRAGFYHLLVSPFAAFIKIYLFKKGFAEGIRGFIYSCMASFNTFMKYAKLWEFNQSQSGPSDKPEVNK